MKQPHTISQKVLLAWIVTVCVILALLTYKSYNEREIKRQTVTTQVESVVECTLKIVGDGPQRVSSICKIKE